ncbi:sensor histidine kinase [Algoriphagus marinus]|uniref:sensor histidine kinase n=1 Tax=Algoriphagus marinus TaxID=1925762 RepID=UPI00094B88E7|nr:sensor histidine kinase [Algoriphagus marinus]
MKIEKAPKLEKVKTYSIITLVLVILGSAISFWVANRIDYYTAELVHTEEVLQSTDKLYATILERETSIRGYLLTGNEDFLANYENSITNGREVFNHILNLTEDNPVQQNYLQELNIFMKQRLDVFERSKEYYKINKTLDGFLNNSKVEDAVNGHISIKNLINQINAEEERILIQRNEILINNVNALPFIVGLISFFSILMGALTLFSIFHYNRASKINDQKIKNYQETLKEKIELLNESNNELKQFAYIASHDLQEPLRKITSFSDLLKEQFDEKLEGEGKHYMERITASANRMRQLITDLLEYSRAGRDSMESIKMINLEDILDSVLDDLEISITEKDAKIKYENLPTIEGKETELRQVFQNLISNSLKFSQAGIAPEITITASNAPIELISKYAQLDQSINYYLIKVADNGIGFDQDYADTIFTIFQRLHGKSEFEGTGIGLSITRKIIEKNNGLILAEGKPEIGATFIIILPKP